MKSRCWECCGTCAVASERRWLPVILAHQNSPIDSLDATDAHQADIVDHFGFARVARDRFANSLADGFGRGSIANLDISD